MCGYGCAHGWGHYLSPDRVPRSLPTADACQSNAFHQVALKEDDQKDTGNDGDRRTGHHIAPFRAMLALEHLQTQRDGYNIFSINYNKRPEEVIPEGDEGKEAQHAEGGPGQWQNDLPEDAQAGGTIDQSGFFKLKGNR